MNRGGNERRALALMLTPYAIGLGVLVMLPALATLVLTGFEWDFIGSPRFVGLGNVAELLRDEVFRISLRNTLVFVVLSVPLRLVGAVGLALLLHARYRAVGMYRTAVFLPSIVPDVAFALVWLWLLNPLYGPLNITLAALGLPTPSWLTEGVPAQWAIVIMGVLQIGEGLLIALATRQAIPTDLYALAEVEGARPTFVLWRVTLPLMAPTLALLVFRDTIFLFQANFVPALLVTGGGPPPYSTTYLPLFVYEEAFVYLRYGYAATATLAMMLVTALVVYLQWRIVVRWRHSLLI